MGGKAEGSEKEEKDQGGHSRRRRAVWRKGPTQPARVPPLQEHPPQPPHTLSVGQEGPGTAGQGRGSWNLKDRAGPQRKDRQGQGEREHQGGPGSLLRQPLPGGVSLCDLEQQVTFLSLSSFLAKRKRY